MDRFLHYFLKTSTESLTYREPGKLTALENATVRLEKRFDTPPVTPRPIDLDALLDKIKRGFEADGPGCIARMKNKDKSWLPWLLFHGKAPQPATWFGFIEAAIEDFRKQQRWSRLNVWIHVYLRHYDAGGEPTKKLAQFIQHSLAQYVGAQPRLINWKNRMLFLFTSNGVKNTLSWLLDSDLSTDDALAGLGFEGELAFSPFITDLLDHAIIKCSQDPPDGMNRIVDLLEVPSGRGPKPRDLRKVKNAASILIKTAAQKPSVPIDKTLYPVFLRHLTDPRLPGGRTRWADVAPESVKLFTQWLAREDLTFFFSLVDRTAKDSHWQDRRVFWESYLKHIEMTWVVLGTQARRLVVGTHLEATLNDRRYGRLSKARHDQSVFLIQMGGHVFVEWSHDGASRMWKQQEAPFDFGSREYEGPDLRAPNFVERFTHQGNWQPRVITSIYRHTGLQPDSRTIRRSSSRSTGAYSRDETPRNVVPDPRSISYTSVIPYLITILNTEGNMTTDALCQRYAVIAHLQLDKQVRSTLNRCIFAGIAANKIKYGLGSDAKNFRDRVIGPA